MSKSITTIQCFLILIFIFGLNSSGFSIGPCPPDCPGSFSTIPGTVNCNPNWVPQWDRENSAKQFPSGEPPVSVYVTEGLGPYNWTVSDGFTIDCSDNCGTSNTVSSLGTHCIATITVTDRCGNQTTGEVRRAGYWDTQTCYRYKLTHCYRNWCNSLQLTEIDFVSHKVDFSCCGYTGNPEVTGTCSDGFEYTASIYDCHLYSFCLDDPSYDPGIFSLSIRKWICY